MFKRMKKIYDIEFHEVDSAWCFVKEERYYIINKNENKISLVEKFPSNIITNLNMLEVINEFSVFWDDSNLGIVFPEGKSSIQHRNIVGTISKVKNNKYFFLLRRTNFYA